MGGRSSHPPNRPVRRALKPVHPAIDLLLPFWDFSTGRPWGIGFIQLLVQLQQIHFHKCLQILDDRFVLLTGNFILAVMGARRSFRGPHRAEHGAAETAGQPG